MTLATHAILFYKSFDKIFDLMRSIGGMEQPNVVFYSNYDQRHILMVQRVTMAVSNQMHFINRKFPSK